MDDALQVGEFTQRALLRRHLAGAGEGPSSTVALIAIQGRPQGIVSHAVAVVLDLSTVSLGYLGLGRRDGGGPRRRGGRPGQALGGRWCGRLGARGERDE